MMNEDFLNLVKTQLQEYENAPLKIMSNHCVVHTRRNLKITLNVCSCSCDESNCDELSKRSFRVVVILLLKRVW